MRYQSAFAVLLFLGALLSPAPAGATDYKAKDIFDDRYVHDIWIDLDPTDWATLKAHYLENTYYKARFTWNGVSANVGIRSRGRGSRSPIKPNIDVNINKYVKGQTFLGLGYFTLKANNQDASCMHERLAFKLFQRMGLPAPREAPVRLHINGEYFGFFTIVERVDEDFLSRNFGENGGYLYEWKPNAIYRFEYLGADAALYSPFFLDPKNHDDDPNVQPFIDMVAAINQSSDADFVAAVSQYIDPKLYLAHAAIENALTELDGILGDTYGMNNLYLYRFQDRKLAQFIVWDKDLTFQGYDRGIWDNIFVNKLANRLFAIPEYHDAYMSALVKAANLLGGSDGWAAKEVARIYQQIKADATNDPLKQCPGEAALVPCGAAEFEAEVEHVKEFLPKRLAYVLSEAERVGYRGITGTAELTSAAPVLATAGAPLAPGALAQVAGANLGSGGVAGTLPLPRVLGNTYLAINGVRAPLTALSANSAILQVPFDTPVGAADITAVVGGAIGATLTVPVTSTSPSIIAITHGDGSVVSADRPLTPGVASPSDPPAELKKTPLVTVGGAAAQVFFAGLTPGLVGLNQVNFIVPATATGPATLALTAEGRTATVEVTVH